MKLQILVDGKPVDTVEVPTVENETTTVARDAQRSNREVRVYLTAGEHMFPRGVRSARSSASPFPRRPPDAGRFGGAPQPCRFIPRSSTCRGRFPAKGEHPTPGEDSDLRSGYRNGLHTEDRGPARAQGYRRPVTKAEVATLVAVAQKALDTGFTPDQSVQFAIQAMLVSPQLPVSRRARSQGQVRADLRSRTRLAPQLLPLELDARRGTAEAGRARGKLRKPGVSTRRSRA